MESLPDLSSAVVAVGEASSGVQTASPSQVTCLPEPEVVTDWLVEVRLNASEPCPLGFVCDDTLQANCTNIRAVALAYGFGDVHAGAYCPEGVDGLQVCPAGAFCPTAETIYRCPEGYFCPDKTSVPTISCPKCPEGATQLVRERYGYFILGTMFALALIWIFVGRRGKSRANLVAQFVELSSRSLDSARFMHRRAQRAKELKRLKPKLFAIQKRLEKLQQDSAPFATSTFSPSSKSRSSNAALVVEDSGKIHYNPCQLFDALDSDNNGKLDFDELQHVLELKPEQLEAFVTRMNELGGQRNNANYVSRAVFVKHFLTVLEETSNFGPTQPEIEELFDELAHGTNVAKYVDFFDSRLSIFLSDPQINKMIAEFRKILLEDGAKKKWRSIIRSKQQYCADIEEQRPGREIITGDSATVRRGESIDPPNPPFTSRIFPLTTRVRRGEPIGPSIPRPLSSRMFSRANLFVAQDTQDVNRTTIHRVAFCKYYAEVLSRVTQDPKPDTKEGDSCAQTKGVDLAFEDLSLAVSVGDKEVNVVNAVSGRLPARTMTALMGCSGSGKTSLLNALCGRAYYGTTKGTIRINGHVATIEEHKGCTGFVPQDDIVHAELTVKENLIYSGRFSFAKGTTDQDIEDYADTVLAYLGLSRVADSIVGDMNRRGVSGGEKKRVNIGVELMSKPSILFLDEPTSGLDSSSALLVMGSLKKLVESQGVTVLSVIHQPRKAIFDSFDSLILLGMGGNMVYHGSIATAQAYFANLPHPYLLPPGESLADWLIDVSSGRLPTNESKTELEGSTKPDEIENYGIVSERKALANTVDDAISRNGPSAAKFERSLEHAKERCQVLYKCWIAYYQCMSPKEMQQYAPPKPYDLPKPIDKPGFWTQVFYQIQRNFLMMWRNRISKLVDTTMIVGAVVLISFLQGILEITTPFPPGLSFDELVEGDPDEIEKTFPALFTYAMRSTQTLMEYALKIGVITSVLLGLTAAKSLTAKRLEFFRESASGWDVNAYFLALNVTSTLEHVIQMILAASCAFWIRSSLTTWTAYSVQMIMLMWMTVSWSFLIPLLVPSNNTVLAVGFFMAFFGLLFSGAKDPVTYRDMYQEGNEAMAIISGIFSVTRYFIEGMTVQEQRCLPAQSGFTVEPTSVDFPVDSAGSFHLEGLAQNDLSVVQLSCSGWYWGVVPAFFVGLSIRILAAGIFHVSERSRQNKKSIWSELQKKPLKQNKTFHVVISFVILVLVLFAISAWLIVRQVGNTGIMEPPTTEEGSLALMNFTFQQDLPGVEWPPEWKIAGMT